MKKGVLIVALAMAPALNAKEKERFTTTVETGYNAVSHRTTFSYPDADEKFVSGTSFQGNGVHGAVGMKLSSVVSVGARFDHNFLRQPFFTVLALTVSGAASRTMASVRVQANGPRLSSDFGSKK